MGHHLRKLDSDQCFVSENFYRIDLWNKKLILHITRMYCHAGIR